MQPEGALENFFSDIFISGTALLNRCEQFKLCVDLPPNVTGDVDNFMLR